MGSTGCRWVDSSRREAGGGSRRAGKDKLLSVVYGISVVILDYCNLTLTKTGLLAPAHTNGPLRKKRWNGGTSCETETAPSPALTTTILSTSAAIGCMH